MFFDTSVLVAASSASHPHHPQAFEALRLVKAAGNQGWISQRSLAEVYAILTSAPLTPRIHPSEALRILEDSLLPHFRVVALGPKTIWKSSASRLRRAGAVAGYTTPFTSGVPASDRLYTFNVKDFRALATEDFQSAIGAP